MHAAFSYDRRDPYTRLPIDSQPDPITHINNLSEHVSDVQLLICPLSGLH